MGEVGGGGGGGKESLQLKKGKMDGVLTPFISKNKPKTLFLKTITQYKQLQYLHQFKHVY